MASSSYNYSLWKKQEVELLDVGEKLLRLPSSTDEILLLLEKVESILAMVHQGNHHSKADALIPLMKALIAKELFRHADLNIQVAVASCLNQITRITAPRYPYEDDDMKEIFQLFMVALKQLLTKSDINLMRAQVILKSLAQVRSCLMMLDIEVDSMIVEMFQFFLSTIWSNHSDIFKHMETVMILIINESDEVSLELLAPLLDSVRKNMKETSPISWELGKTIFEKCGPKLQPYLREAMKSLNLKLDDYAEIVASLCTVTANEPNMVSESDKVPEFDHNDPIPQMKDGNGSDDKNSMEDNADFGKKVVSGKKGFSKKERIGKKIRREIISPKSDTRDIADKVSESDKVSEDDQDDSIPITMDGNGLDNFDDKNSTENSAEFVLPVIDNTSPSNNELNGKGIVHSEKRVRKMNSLLKPEEGYAHIWTRGSQNSSKVSPFLNQVSESDRVLEASQDDRTKDENVESHLSSKTEETFSRLNIEYGEEMVNARIKVWWPLDKTFYTGTVKTFDPLTKKHKIEYDDDEEEILNLGEERWELFKERAALTTSEIMQRE